MFVVNESCLAASISETGKHFPPEYMCLVGLDLKDEAHLAFLQLLPKLLIVGQVTLA